jgi:hypothetical protein
MRDDLRRLSKIQNVDKPSLVGKENLTSSDNVLDIQA